MATYTDKDVIHHWLRLHNRLKSETYQVESWPDDDSSKKNVDALCRDAEGRTLAIEHTLIEPYPGHKEDTARFLKTLAALENHPSLVQKGNMVMVSQRIGAIPKGIKWNEVAPQVLGQLAPILPGMAEGARTITVNDPKWNLDLRLSKRATAPGDAGSFLTSRMECSLGMWRNGLEIPGSELDGSEHAVCFALGYNVGKVQIKVSALWQTETSTGQIKGCVPGTGC
jgi:hypothetical protein